MKLDYDQSADVLYVTFATSKVPAKYVETVKGQILRVNKRTGKILSCTIPMFSRRAREGDIVIPEARTKVSGKAVNSLIKRSANR